MNMEVREYKIQLLENMLGTVPKDEEVFKTYIESQKPITITEDEAITIEKIEEKGWTGFHKDPEKGLLIKDYLFKGFIKHAGNTLKESLGIKALKSKITEFVFVFPRNIFLGKMQPDGVFERPLRAMTPQGERVCLARSDYVKSGTVFSLTIGLLKHPQINWKAIDALMSHGILMGLGQFRNGSFGRFVVLEHTEEKEIDVSKIPSLLM